MATAIPALNHMLWILISPFTKPRPFRVFTTITRSMAPTDRLSTLYSTFADLQIRFESFSHGPARTAEDVISIFEGKPYQKVKNLFLYDKKKRFYVVSAQVESDVNLKTLSTLLSAPNPRFANEEQMTSILGVSPGSVTPLAAMNDTKNQVTFVFDEAFKNSQDPLLVHPLHNEETLSIKLDDLLKFMENCNHDITWINFNAELSNGTTLNVKATDKKLKTLKEPIPTISGTEQLGITAKKSENFSEWYTQVITRSDMIEYYDVSGCYILRPWSFFMWECVQDFMNARLKKLGVQNCYFPMFVSKSNLETEKEHVKGFSPEVAWVTRYGECDLAEPIAIRPTSETIMYPAYAKWIRSHRDLPLKLNQWCQVVRWEFKQPTPFIRTREFLWQEGHTAHTTDNEAETLTFEVLEIYANAYEQLLAVPVIKGIKSENEKFAGAKMTTTVETLIPENGRGVQAATSHHLGTNFSKMFGISFEDRNGDRQFVHQTSWAITTRSLGVAVMLHGDDKGMVMPPRVAPLQVVVIPIIFKGECSNDLLDRCRCLVDSLSNIGIRAKLDDRDNYTPGWKYNDWETKGVCIRMEIGPRDMKNQTVKLVRRDTGTKSDHKWADLVTEVPEMLEDIHHCMFKKAKDKLDSCIVKVTSFADVMPILNEKKLVLAPWCEDPATENEIRQESVRLSTIRQQEVADEGCAPTLTGAIKPLCIPLEQNALQNVGVCSEEAIKYYIVCRTFPYLVQCFK